jgi:hypothetical protein
VSAPSYDEGAKAYRAVLGAMIDDWAARLKKAEDARPSLFTKEQVEALVAMCKANGITHFKQGDLELTFQGPA